MQAFDEITGNHYVALPRIGKDGGIDCINVVWPAAGGLVEWHGADAPLLRIELRVDGVPLDVAAADWRRLDRWIPSFSIVHDDVTLSGTILAPAGGAPARGFIVRVEVENRRRREVDVALEIALHWAGTHLRVATDRPLHGDVLLRTDDALILLTENGRGPALALLGAKDATVPQALHRGEAPLTGTILAGATVQPGRRTAVALHAGAGREQDAALAAARALQRVPGQQWLRETRLELSHLLQPGVDARWSELLNRNLLFNRFYALGRGLADDRLYLMRSRSPDCARGALFNEREGLFWTVPALLIADPPLAREAIVRMLELFSERSGEHERFIDGCAFDSALNTEQILLYAWAAAHYVDETGDASLLDEPLLHHVLRETDFLLFSRLHPEQMLVSTELLPSGEAIDEPWGTMANVMLAYFARRLPELLPAPDEEPPQFRDTAGEIAAAVWQHCVSDVAGRAVIASSADLEGRASVYDDPAFSLALLPFFGFCDPDDPVWRSTMTFLRSSDYPLWCTGEVPGSANRSHPGRPHLAALLADVIAWDRDAALERLARIRMPDGLAAANWNPQTGAAAETHHAALAGLLAWTLRRVTREPGSTDRNPRRGHRR